MFTQNYKRIAFHKHKELQLTKRCYCEFFPTSIVQIIKNKNNVDSDNLDAGKTPKTGEKSTQTSKQSQNKSKEFRVNEVNIQMLSKNLYDQLFKSPARNIDPKVIKECQDHLKRHGIDVKKCEHMPDVTLKLPDLEGSDLVEHFRNIGEKQSVAYRELLQNLVSCKLPAKPKKWMKVAGWHKYSGKGPPQPVPCPDNDALVFDVEVLMSAGKRPTLACAVSPDAWYGWVSSGIAKNDPHQHYPTVSYESLIPLETDNDIPFGDITRPRVVVGHNVSYDRTKIKEQYWLERSGVRFMDTMSMHTCVSGVTSYQRAILKSKGKEEESSEDWMDISSLNSLSEVHKLYCGTTIDKETRDIFVEGTTDDVHAHFQSLMAYCANDVISTHNVLRELFPMFLERFPHPVTLAGMLELGSTYLPINSNWLQYIDSSETVFEDCQLETRQLLSLKADHACRLMIDNRYEKDLWMWDQDWSTQTLKLKKVKTKKKNDKDIEAIEENEVVMPVEKKIVKTEDDFDSLNLEYIEYESETLVPITETTVNKRTLQKQFQYLYDLAPLLPARRPYLPGYPAWYRKLCTKPTKDPDWTPGANNITTTMKITPKLLRLTWEGYPLHHTADDKWGFLVPFAHRRPETYVEEDEPQIPLQELLAKCPVKDVGREDGEHSNKAMEKLSRKVEEDMGRRTYYARKKLDEIASENKYHGLGVWSGIQLQGCCHFLRLPHKDGPKYKVGNPLARDFIDMFSQNVLSAQGGEAEKVLNFGRMMSYWRNNKERIMGQQAVWLPPDLPVGLPARLPGTSEGTDKKYGAILPQVVVAGTLTRRASEPTWMTASNAHKERIGSELRSMVQAPPGYKFVGADVDSQELWIAGLLGDSSRGVSGGSAFSWSTLAGHRAAASDLHSLTAAAAGLARDQAKVVNYARIYGAGQNFAERLLKQFNPTMTNAEAKSKAIKMYTTTKGRRVYTLKQKYMEGFMDEDLDGKVVEMTSYQAMRLAKMSGKSLKEMFERPKWVGGTESDMFNKLEEIADSEHPATAFLSGRMSRALENTEGKWDGTKHNWCVQSAAADFLHLMLVSMRWLQPDARFCLSFHDEVRYVVQKESVPKAALSLHCTNLLARAFCALRVGINDLPQSVAFFSSVEVDQVLRKECDMSCVTPSNPHGLKRGYGIEDGESLNIFQVMEKCGIKNCE